MPMSVKSTFRLIIFTKACPIETASKAVLRSISSCCVNISSIGMYCTLNFDLSYFVLSIALSKSLVGSYNLSSGIDGKMYGS